MHRGLLWDAASGDAISANIPLHPVPSRSIIAGMRSSAPLWYRWVTGGLESSMPFEERARVSVTRAAAIGMALAGPFFAVWNLAIGRHQLLPFNLVLAAAGILGLALALRGSTRWAFTVVTAGASLVFAVGGLLYRNGVENFLLVLIAATVLVIESDRLRRIMAAAYGLAFFAVKLFHALGAEQPGVGVTLFAVNILLFLVSLIWFLELARRLSTDYRKTLERTNEELAERRRELASEHTALLERSRELEESNRTKERLFSILAHDLRGPVGTLGQALGMLDEGMLSPDEFRRLIPQLRSDTGAVQECLESLLAWAKSVLHQQPAEVSALSLSAEIDAVRRLLGPTAAFKGVDLAGQGEGIVLADPNRLRVVLRNLTSNAIKFTPSGGNVTLRALPVGESVRIEIVDTGVGIDPDTLEKILEGDVAVSLRGTNNESGTGLGLRLCRELLAEMGSRLDASSTPGGGTRIAFVLPRGNPAAAEPVASQGIRSPEPV